MINGRKIGLCLGSGGARGLAHVGVLQVLEENGIIPDIISGCSAGAIFGAVYAAGTNLYLLEKYLGTVEARTIVDMGIPIHGGFLSGDKIEELVLTLTHDLSFGETKIPFVCIATDLVTGEMKVFEEGKLHRAVRASMAVPGVFTPAVIDGHYYVDGGVLEELPFLRSGAPFAHRHPSPLLRHHAGQADPAAGRQRGRDHPSRRLLHGAVENQRL